MFEMLDELEILIRQASLHTRMAVMFVSILAGIAVNQVTFALLRKATDRMTNKSYPLVRRAFRGIHAIWGILLGGFIAVQILTISPRGLMFLERMFNLIGILSLTIMGARLVSNFLTQKLQKPASTFASTSILVTLIELVVYIAGFKFLLQSFGVSINPRLTALGVGGLAVALALQDILAILFSGINILLSKQTKTITISF